MLYKAYELENGVVVIVRNKPLSKLKPYLQCANCFQRKYCTEGCLSIRLTTGGIVKPCLVRSDNCFDLKSNYDQNGYEATKDMLFDYLSRLEMGSDILGQSLIRDIKP